MENAKAVKTPVEKSVKLVKAIESENSVDQQLYQSAVGGLLYLSIGTRRDIACSEQSSQIFFTSNQQALGCSKTNNAISERYFRFGFTLHQRKLIQVYWLLRFRLGRRSG